MTAISGIHGANPVQGSIVTDEFLGYEEAGKHIIKNYQTDKPFESKIRFNGYEILVKIDVAEDLTSIHTEEDRRKKYWRDELGRIPTIATISCLAIPPMAKKRDVDFFVKMFASFLNDHFFKVDRLGTSFDPCPYTSGKTTYQDQIEPPLNYYPLESVQTPAPQPVSRAPAAVSRAPAAVFRSPQSAPSRSNDLVEISSVHAGNEYGVRDGKLVLLREGVSVVTDDPVVAKKARDAGFNVNT